jgi:negative regulator of flagellin synthesis FlgM
MAVDITGVSTTPLSGNKTDSTKTASSNILDPNNQGSGRAATTVANTTTPITDKITLTQQAEDLRMIEKAVNEQTGVDNERVESLKLEIDSGRYDIDTQRVAEKLIQFEMQFVA